MCWFCSDLKVKVAGKKLSAHKFVLAARSDVWSLANLASTSELDLSGKHPWFDNTQCYLLSVNLKCVVQIKVRYWSQFNSGWVFAFIIFIVQIV